ncbi:hypothetical protein DFO70_101115 [Cytobacillus firmus]|uniref:Uncharacterized protein n=2 Tax=Cytobacillus TaxID=2675230 RepID=A0A366K6T2_CYTFI|nr:hypothetical protein [Cytobacillus oceanisediminis]RBP96311.1 hypothetical protein DFO70_101115 [Cytobacillus firmus]TDX45963.1 hypothetical protein DFO72_102442 [Cytobacillus oceanisediminis]
MAITLPHIEDPNNTAYFPPVGNFETFQDDAHYEEKVREWGLSTTREVKKEFWYKEKSQQRLVTVKGYQVYGESGDYYTIIIEFQDGNLSCIHPAYLKEMQSPSFGKAMAADFADTSSAPPSEKDAPKKENEKHEDVTKNPAENSNKTKPSAKKAKKEKQPALELPAEKVHFTAKVKQFALSWNHFNEDNDEVIVLEDVVIQENEPIEVGLGWCSHSKTLKKFELQPGESLEFDGKIVKKKLPKGKDCDKEFIVEETVTYKINNPSKIKKS